MKRKNFLKKTATVIAGTTIVPFSPCQPQNKEKVAATKKVIRKNWAGFRISQNRFIYYIQSVFLFLILYRIQYLGLVRRINTSEARAWFIPPSKNGCCFLLSE